MFCQVVAVAFAHAGDQIYVAGVENVIKVRRAVHDDCVVQSTERWG